MSIRQPPAPKYTHLIVECRGCPQELIDDQTTIRKALRMAAKTCHLHIMREGVYRFRPQGVTGYVLLSESHISAHTWPESGFALVDVLSCVDVEREPLVACFRRLLKPTRTIVVALTAPERA